MLPQLARRLLQGKSSHQMVMQQRLQSVVCSKPKHPLTTAEALFLGGGMMVAILAVPLYVLIHIPSYVKARRASG